MVAIFAVGLLGTTPGRVTHDVDAHAAEVIAPQRTQLTPNRVANPLFQRRIPARPACHRHREGGRAGHDDPTRAIGEAHAGDAQARYSASYPGMLIVAASKHFGEAGPERRIAVHRPDLLLEGELVEQPLRPLLDLCIGQRFGGRQGPKGIGSIKGSCRHRVSSSWLGQSSACLSVCSVTSFVPVSRETDGVRRAGCLELIDLHSLPYPILLICATTYQR